VIVTVSALHSSSDGARLLGEALARRGVRRIFVDELHTISRHHHAASMADYSDALNEFEDVLGRLLVQLRRQGHPRPQVVGCTSTMPPAAVGHVRRRACMSSSARVVRCAIDRPELQFVRLPFPARLNENLVRWGARVLAHLVEVAPVWALDGRIIVFCPTARFARKAWLAMTAPTQRGAACPAAAAMRVPRLDGSARPVFLFLGVHKMSSSERQKHIDGFGESDGGILFTNESSSHGAGKPGVRMVVHLALAKGPVESWQRSGRCARQACERGVVVHVTSTRGLVQYLQLVKPVGTPLVGTLLLLKQLICDGCLRATFLTFLGQGSAPYPCSGCDHCARLGTVDGSSSLGCLGYGLVWSRATEAAVALADHWPDKSTLGALLKMGGQHAPPLSTAAVRLAGCSRPAAVDSHRREDGETLCARCWGG
jgi:superfamily II DNA helicase RecQ